MEYIAIFLSCSSKEETEKITKGLLDKKLIACAKYYPINSMFYWKGQQDSGNEFLVIYESRLDKYDEIEKIIKELHSYEQISMYAVPMIKTVKGVSEWIDEAVS